MNIGDNQNQPIFVGQTSIEYVENFQYLGSYISRTGDAEIDVKARIGKAAAVFERLRPIWKSGAIRNDMKLRLYQSIVLPTTIYAGETWKRTAAISNKLDVFHRRCLRTILGISWKDHITNEELMKRAGMEDLRDIVTTRRRRFAGHVMRLPKERPAKVAMRWTPKGGKRKRGRPRITWRKTFQEDLQEMGIDWDSAQSAATDRSRWRDRVARCFNRSWRN